MHKNAYGKILNIQIRHVMWVVRYDILMDLLDEDDLMTIWVNNKNENLMMLHPNSLIR